MGPGQEWKAQELARGKVERESRQAGEPKSALLGWHWEMLLLVVCICRNTRAMIGWAEFKGPGVGWASTVFKTEDCFILASQELQRGCLFVQGFFFFLGGIWWILPWSVYLGLQSLESELHIPSLRHLSSLIPCKAFFSMFLYVSSFLPPKPTQATFLMGMMNTFWFVCICLHMESYCFLCIRSHI